MPLFLGGMGSTKGKIDFFEEYVFDLGSEVGDADDILAYFGGRHGLGEVDGCPQLLCRGD